MGDEKDKPVVGRSNAAGRVQVDSRGRNVWHWNDARIDIDSTTILLKRLENDALELEPTQSVPIPKPLQGTVKAPAKSSAKSSARSASKRAGRERAADDEWSLSESMRIELASGGGFDPYNSST